jgi:hypothetical protein
MATRTLATSVPLTAVVYNQSPNVLLPADIAAVSQMIRNDQNTSHPALNGAFDYRGILIVPNRFAGLRVLPGDVLAVDANGWPVLVSAYSIATGGWTLV